MKTETSQTTYMLMIAVLVLAGQTMAFDDAVEQQKVNCESATYVNDNKVGCDE